MNKKLTSLLLAVVMVLSMLATAVPSFSKSSQPPITISVVPDKTEANPGDTINYQVILGPVTDWADCEFTFVIPEGLTYISATVSDVITGHFQGGWTEKTKRFVVYGGEYTSDSDTLLLTVACKVEESAIGSDLKIYLYDPFFCDGTGEDYKINNYDEGESLDFDSGNSVTVKAPQTGYTVSFYANGGTGAMADVNNVSGEYTLPECGFTAPEGMRFYGWLAGGQTYQPGDKLTVSDDIVITAQWEVKPVVYTVSFAANGGTGTMADATGVSGEYTLPDCGFIAPEGKIFKCWNVGGNNYHVSEIITVTANTTVTAVWVCNHETLSDWVSDGTHHWKTCQDCGITIETTKESHISTGENVATCQKQAVCNVCSKSYGSFAPHAPEATWSKDENGHWYACGNAGCEEKLSFAVHTPDHVGGATEEYAIKCSVCLYIIEEQLSHTHVFSEEVATETYKATGATCTAAATYYKSCKCGEKGTETFSYGDALGHNPGGNWQRNGTHHWKVCVNANCGEVVESTKAAHTPDHVGGATEEYAIKCSVCNYVMEEQLTHTHVFSERVPTEFYKAKGATCTAPASYYKSCKCGEKGTATFSYGNVLGHNPGSTWERNETHHWKVCVNENCGVVINSTKAAHTPDHEGGASEDYAVTCTVCHYIIHEQLSHTHVFDQEVAREPYKANNATCTEAATYYYSCTCGEKGSDTFAYGEAAGHDWDEATCTAPKTCTVCGTPDGEPLPHSLNDYYTGDESGHWKECENCDFATDAEPHVDEDEDYICDLCDVELPEDTTGPSEPEESTEPSDPEESTEPSDPEESTEPSEPEESTEPSDPEESTEPSQSEETTEPEATTKPGVDNPETGDSTMQFLLITLLLVSSFAVAAIMAVKKRIVK